MTESIQNSHVIMYQCFESNTSGSSHEQIGVVPSGKIMVNGLKEPRYNRPAICTSLTSTPSMEVPFSGDLLGRHSITIEFICQLP